jgi:hypothetical protein
MPANKRISRDAQLAALAYNDAVRDILRSDGKFDLGDERSRDAVWEWDGVTWSRIPLVDRPGRPGGAAVEEPPYVEVERDEDLAVAP